MSEAIIAIDEKKLAEDQAKLRAKFVKLQSNKIHKKSLRGGAKFLAKQAKQVAPVGDDYDRKSERAGRIASNAKHLYHKKGALKRGITVSAGKVRKKGEISFLARTGKREKMGIPPDSKWYYPAIVEYGPKKGPRQWPGKQYMRKTFESHGQQAIAMVIDESKAGIEQLMAGQ